MSHVGVILAGSAIWLAVFLLLYQFTAVLGRAWKESLPKQVCLSHAQTVTIASYLTSSLNAVICCCSVPVALHAFPGLKNIFSNLFEGQGIYGPLLPHTQIFYYSFLGYLLYDGLFMVLNPVTAARDWYLVSHHVLYFSITLFFFETQKFPLLALTLVAQEISTPFLNAFWIMKILKVQATASALFFANAVLMTFLFGLLRVIVPGAVLATLLYLASKGTYDDKLSRADWTVVLIVAMGCLLQVYWFGKILVGFRKAFSGDISAPTTPEQAQLVRVTDDQGDSDV